ncbi:hypothetical protein HSBAA_PA_3260 (plasmid) [Vreelandella sulfidaeris]|uniref:Uncharacterized protein n=1 Tax=Vreelandella sulfidaeris TaxID=115553 RepID=A0A455UK36_9GAMM|nr:hypothetical protein HSBAA_PA_3260 [Halomonas sulfidaeris]
MSVEAIIEPSDYVAPDTFNQFLADLKARARQTKSPIISPRMFCLALGMDVQTLASRAHVHRVTVNRAQGLRSCRLTYGMRCESWEQRLT